MSSRILLYIDILGFSELVAQNPNRIDDLYEVIASLNVHHHDAFRCVVFSDTVLVYNTSGGDTPRDIEYLVMFECEFAKDLLHRLAGRNIYFRAVITRGQFRHYQLNEVPCFYGRALVDAYKAEKRIKAIGLFIANELLPYCDIFHYIKFNKAFSFVYMTQATDEVENLCASKIDDIGYWINERDLNWNAGPELMHIADICRAVDSDIPKLIRQKYIRTLKLYRLRYPYIVQCIQNSNYNISSVAPDADWASVVKRHPESCTYAINTRMEF